MVRRERLAALVLALPGVVAPFLPFVYDVWPFRAIGFHELSLLAAPLFLAMPIAAWQARRYAGARLSAIEVGLAYLLATGAMLSVQVFIFAAFRLSELSLRSLSPLGLVLLAGCWGFALANVLLLVRNLVRRVPKEVTAEVFLLGGYLPNAVSCLIFAFPWRWRVGAYVVLIACIVYLVTIILLLRGEAHRPGLS